MKRETLDKLIESERALVAALDADDAGAIERGTSAYASALEDVRSQGGWQQQPELKERAQEALHLADALRVRINVLADMTRQRLQLLRKAAGREAAPPVYTRDGRVRG